MRLRVPVLVRQHPGDVGGRGGVDQFRLLVQWRRCAHGDDQGVVAKERGGEGYGV